MKSTLIALLSLSTLSAGEYTVKESRFDKTVDLDASFLPEKAVVLSIDPEEWTSFEIQELVDHGATVKKGDVLIQCDLEKYQKNIAELEKEVAGRKIKLIRAERDLAGLEISTPRTLEEKRDKLARAQDSFDYFTSEGRALEEEAARQKLEMAQLSLAGAEEELKQLLKMYSADQVTEETEEIILKRQRANIKFMRFQLKRTEKATTLTLEKKIPNKATDLKRGLETSKLVQKAAEKNLPDALDEKRLSVAKMKRKDLEADEKLAKLKKDAELFSITAPIDGTVYYGSIKNGVWSLGQTAKFLRENGTLPKKTPLMSVVPTDTTLSLHSSVEQAKRLHLTDGNTAKVTVPGLDDERFNANLITIDNVPNAAGEYHAAFSVDLPADSPIVGGMKSKIKVVTYRNEKALTVPTNAIKKKSGKSTVEVKLADGTKESREITIGKANNKHTEVLSGLQIDQVVVTP